MAAVAVAAGKHRHITTPHSAIEWLIGHKCNRGLATELVCQAAMYPKKNPFKVEKRLAPFIERDHPVAEKLLHLREHLRSIKNQLKSRQRNTINTPGIAAQDFTWREQQIAEARRWIQRTDEVGLMWVLNWPVTTEIGDEVTNG